MNINDLDTGDIILFSGNYITSDIIEYITNSKYLITSGVCLSETLGKVVKKRGGVLLN